jgi:hypothetical protein
MDKLWANMDSQDSSRPGLRGSHHLPPYNILCAWPRDQHPNVIFSLNPQVGVLKFSQLGLLQLWGAITLRANLQLRWGLKQSCSPYQEFSNNISHATYTQGNRGDSWLLVVRNQIANFDALPSHGVKPTWGFHKVKLRKVETWRHAPGFQL